MQAGFAMVETGFTRAKNAGNIIMKNLMDFALGTPIFWLLGFGLMFGTSIGGIIGTPDVMITGSYAFGNLPTWAYVIFQTVFCATAATIVSGAMAERTKFSAYCIYSMVISAVIYPVSGHWIWGGGWLPHLGFTIRRFHRRSYGRGLAALIGAKMLGPRIGKYGPDGKPRAILGHSLTLALWACSSLWFCGSALTGAQPSP
jgi:Amt family ammonium transporter